MLRRRLAIPAAAMALALSLMLTGLGLWTGYGVVSIMSHQLIRQMTEAVRRDVADMMKDAEQSLTRAVDDIARHDVPLGDPVALAHELYGLLGDEPSVDWLFCGNEAGGAIDAGKLADGTLVFLMTDDFRAGVMREYAASPDGQMAHLRKSGVEFDAHQKLWYSKAKDTQERYWTEPFLGSAEPILGMALSMPVFARDGGFAGVCGIDLILTQLSNIMNSLSLGDNGRAFIMDAGGQLIASSGGVAPVTTAADGKESRLHASDAGDAIVRETARHLAIHPDIVSAASTGGLQTFSFDAPMQGTIHAAVTRLEQPSGIDWTIVSALPASDFLGPIRQEEFLSLVIGGVIVALSLILGLFAVGRALRPMTELTESAQAIAKGEWRELPEVKRNDEIGLLAQAFNLMTARLRDTLDGLRRSEESYRAIFENALEGIIRTSADGKVLAANPAFVQIFGYDSVEEMIEGDRKQFWARPQERDAVISELTNQGTVVGYEAEFVRKDGGRIWLSFSSRMLRDASGQPLAFESFVTDITERKRAAEALQKARAELTHVARVMTLGELTASIAHEVNQPLAAIVTNGSACQNWLAGNPPNLEKARQSVANIIADGNRAAEVVQRIRALAKRSPARKDSLDINLAIREVMALTHNELQRNRVALQTHLAGDLPPILGDRVQLQQVILNLIVNAIEAMSAVEDGRRELQISSAKDGSTGVLVDIRDTGIGLEPDRIDHIFDAFYTTKPGGLGMGLAISRSIIEAHGGRLWATRNAPRGTIFQFILPVDPAL